jgi:thioredoxin 1
MAMDTEYQDVDPPRAGIKALREPTVIEFGSPWCGYCRAAQPLIAEAFADHPEVRHIKIEDGRHRRLGRTFKVKLWPTLIFLADGQEVARVVRPTDADSICRALEQIDPRQRT